MARVTDLKTHIQITRSEMPVDVDGFKIGEPTGKVSCAERGAVAMNVDEIPTIGSIEILSG